MKQVLLVVLQLLLEGGVLVVVGLQIFLPADAGFVINLTVHFVVGLDDDASVAALEAGEWLVFGVLVEVSEAEAHMMLSVIILLLRFKIFEEMVLWIIESD